VIEAEILDATSIDFFKTPSKDLKLKAGVVRIDFEGIGFAFRNLTKEDGKFLDFGV
jgi:hypothetical protein